jgi:hypothetical protein
MVLPRAWFQIRGIPSNYRNKHLMAYDGSMVGLAQILDEDTINFFDFVSSNIMVMDLEKVPTVAPGVFIECLYDFHFQREVSEEEFRKMSIQQSSNVEVEEGKGVDGRFDQFYG